MTSVPLMIVTAVFCSVASASVFKHNGRHHIFQKNYDHGTQDNRYVANGYNNVGSGYRADLVHNVEELKALIHNFMVKFDESNKVTPYDSGEVIKKAMNNMILTLITQSYVHVFKPDLKRNNFALEMNRNGEEEQKTTEEQRLAFISELAAEVKTLPLQLVNDFILKYIAVDDDNELVLQTMIKRRGDDGDKYIQKLKGEVIFGKVIQEMVLQSYMINFNIQPTEGKLTITSSDGKRSRVFNAPPMDTLTKVKMLDTTSSYERKPVPDIPEMLTEVMEENNIPKE